MTDASLARSARGGLLAAALGALMLSSGCATAVFEARPVSVQATSDRHVFKIHVAGFSGPDTAEARAREQIEAFRTRERFASFEILDRRYNLVPSYYEYTVRFSRRS